MTENQENRVKEQICRWVELFHEYRNDGNIQRCWLILGWIDGTTATLLSMGEFKMYDWTRQEEKRIQEILFEGPF